MINIKAQSRNCSTNKAFAVCHTVASMVRTRGTSAFQQEFPLFHALISRDAPRVAALCTPQQAAKCGPGGLSVLMLALLLDADEHLLRLIAAKAPLDATLSLGFSSGELHKWLAAAQLSNSAVLRQQLVPGPTALELAIKLQKAEHAKLLISAGAGLGPLFLERWGRGYRLTDPASQSLRQQLREHALTHHSGRRLARSSAVTLGQVAQLAQQEGRAALCLAALEAAAKRSLQLSEENLRAVLVTAAESGQVDIAMHVVQVSPPSLWHLLLRDVYPRTHSFQTAGVRVHRSVAAVLFPYLAEQLALDKLELPNEWSLRYVINEALQADQPAAALALLRATQQLEEQFEQQQQQQLCQKQPQQRPRSLRPEGSLEVLLRTAASMGHQSVLGYLLEQGAQVLSLFIGRWGHLTYNSIHESVATMLFTCLLQQYVAGSLPLDTRQLAALVLSASKCNRPGSCLALLQAAAARQLALTTEGAIAVLASATLHDQLALVLHISESYGSPLLCELFASSCSVSRQMVHDVLPHLAHKVSAGAVQLDSSRLGKLVQRAAGHQDLAACTAILAAAAQQQVYLTSQDVSAALHVCLRRGCPAELVRLLLHAGAPIECTQANYLASLAVEAELPAILELMLEAGALVDVDMVHRTVEAVSCPCLLVLLRRGRLPVDISKPLWLGQVLGLHRYSCPVLHLLQMSDDLEEGDLRALRMLEILLAAGHRPTVYQNIVLPPGTQPVALYDPLKEQPEDFATDGPARWLWLALEPESWSPATHKVHPPEMKSAFQTVLLAAACRRKAGVSEVPNPAQPPCKRQLRATSLASEGASCPSLAACLSKLPPDLLLHVLHLAARPLSDWLEEL